MSTGLSRVTDADLRRLLKALHHGALRTPVTRSGLIEAAFGHVEEHLDVLIGRDADAARALVVAVIAERSGQRRGGATLALSGPVAPGSRSADTRERVRELLASAERSVLLLGVRAQEDRGLLATLEAIAVPRGVEVTLVGATADALSGLDVPESWRRYAPRDHAVRTRVLVVDRARALLTSDALSGVEQATALHLGVIIDDETFVATLLEELERLTRAGHLFES